MQADRISKRGLELTFISWYAPGRLRERGTDDLFRANGLVAGCGIKHIGTGIHFAWGSDLICIGTLRDAEPSRFYDVIAIMERDDTEPVQRAQGDALTKACVAYIKSDCADTGGYADGIPVLPFDERDYVSQQLKQAG